MLLVKPHLPQVHLGHLETGVEFQRLLEVERGLLVLLQRLVHLPQGEVLQPGVLLLGGLHVEGPLGEEYGVFEVLEVEEDPGEVEEEVGVVLRDGEGLAEALDGQLRVPFDPPVVAYLVQHGQRIWVLKEKAKKKNHKKGVCVCVVEVMYVHGGGANSGWWRWWWRW